MAWNHHPILDDLRYEHGFAEWTDDDVSEHYPSLCGPDGMVDWLALHQRDYDLEPTPHLSDAE